MILTIKIKLNKLEKVFLAKEDYLCYSYQKKVSKNETFQKGALRQILK